MPHALSQIIVAKKPLQDRLRSTRDSRLKRSRRIFFFIADSMFLVLAGIAATTAMHMVHQLEWPFIPTCLVGMVAAMLLQILMAFAAAPLLGSIESMVPSMIIAMISPMTICVLHLFGCESTWPMGAAIGAAFAVGMFVFIQLYGRSCRRAFITDTRPQETKRGDSMGLPRQVLRCVRGL